MEFEKCNVDQSILRLGLIKNKLRQLVEQIITLTQQTYKSALSQLKSNIQKSEYWQNIDKYKKIILPTIKQYFKQIKQFPYYIQLMEVLLKFIKKIVYIIVNGNFFRIIQFINKEYKTLQRYINENQIYLNKKLQKQFNVKNMQNKQILSEMKIINFKQYNKFMKQINEELLIKLRKLHCPCCIESFKYDEEFNKKLYSMNNQQQLLTMNSQSTNKLQNQQNRTEYEYKICKLLNKRGGYLFMGIDRGQHGKQIIKGINLRNNDKEIMDTLKNCVKKYIVPQKLYKKGMKNQEINLTKLMQIDLIPVHKKQILQHLQTNQTSQLRNLYIIRIKIDLTNIDNKKVFYVITPQLNKQEKIVIYQWDNNKVDQYSNVDRLKMQPKHIYPRIIEKYNKQTKQKIYISNQYHKQNPKHDKSQGSAHQTVLKVKQNQNETLKQESLDTIYGRKSKKIYHQESLLLVAKNSQKHLILFEQKLKQNKILYELHEIYQKAKPQNFFRSAYYITHQRSYRQIQQIAIQVNSNKNQFIVLDIRKWIVLLHQKEAFNAIKQLYMPFCILFQKNFSYGQNKKKTDKNNIQYFFVFQNNIEATFAFVMLQYVGIRCNFVNKKKTQDIGFEEVVSCQQLLQNIKEKISQL